MFEILRFKIGVLVNNLSYGNEFDLHENKRVDGTYFHMNGSQNDSF